MNIHFDSGAPIPMKVIKMDTKAEAKAYLTRPPEDTHSVAELEAVHNAIRFTHQNLHEESMSKMDTEELIERRVPKLPR